MRRVAGLRLVGSVWGYRDTHGVRVRGRELQFPFRHTCRSGFATCYREGLQRAAEAGKF
jgi:hypothetical protein